MQETERIEGTIVQLIFTSADTGYTVLALETEDEIVTVVGEMVGVAPGERLVCYGSYVNHPSFGVQFKEVNYEISLPVEANAMLMYLSSGAVKGIGPSTAKKIIRKFGEDAFMIIETDPRKLATVQGISYKQALAIQEDFTRIYGIQDVIVNVSNLGLNARQAIRLYSVYGTNTMDMIHSDPYILCSNPTFLPFERVDKIARNMMLEYDAQQRISGGVLYVLTHNMNNGHCCLPLDRVIRTVSDYIGVEPEKVENTISTDCDGGKLFIENIDGREFLYTASMYIAEMMSAEKLAELIRVKPSPIKNIEKLISTVQLTLGIQYAPNQIKAIKKVAESSASIITGGPGTGKTTLVQGIITMFEMQGDVVSLCAPTGRAAKRLSELSGRNARTIHRLLEVVPGTRNELKFQRGPQNPIPCDVLIIDEFSMVDILLFSQLITALKDGCRIVFVGDYNQLPAVGPGNILKDLIESEIIPFVELTDIFRQAQESDIVLNSHAINRGEKPKSSGRTGDYFMIESGDNVDDLISGLISKRLPAAYGFDNFDDIQILCPSRKKFGGTVNLNTVLQNTMNPSDSKKREIQFNGITFRRGDKVMQIKNNYDLEFTRDDGETDVGVFNGDIGRIIAVNRFEKTLTVRIDDKTYVYPSEYFSQLEHAWAITVHKSQGSEFKAVILCISDTPKELQYRNLLYTAFTRARNLLVVVGKNEILEEMVKNDRKQLRFSGIRHFLREYCVN